MGVGMGVGGASGPRPIEQVHTGMRVVDVQGHEIGTVTDVYLGDPEAATVPEPQDTGVAYAGPAGAVPVTGVGTLGGGVFATGVGTDLPDVERSRLLREGYLRIDLKGLFSGKRFASSEDIADVLGDAVHLTVDTAHLVG
jgi:hypothetical protein